MTSRDNDTPMDEEDILRAWTSQPALLQYIRDQGWVVANRRRHGVTISARTFANGQYTEQDERRQGFFEGVAFALLAELRVSDIKGLTLHLAPIPQPTSDNSLAGLTPELSAGDGVKGSIDTTKEATTADGPHDGGGSEPPAV